MVGFFCCGVYFVVKKNPPLCANYEDASPVLKHRRVPKVKQVMSLSSS